MKLEKPFFVEPAFPPKNIRNAKKSKVLPKTAELFHHPLKDEKKPDRKGF